MNKVFDAYARYYDLLYGDKDYLAEAEYVASCIRSHAPEARRILELGCGTGTHATHLAPMGYTVRGVDMSKSMLARANSRKIDLQPEVAGRLSFDLGDARTFRDGETYDVVAALFHVMSYQTSNDDLAAVFETAAIHLRKGGLFLFDFWYGPAVLTQKPEVRVKRLQDDQVQVTRIAEPVMRVNENVVDVNYSVFIEEKSPGTTHQVRETHRMRYLFLPELAHYRRGIFEERASYAWMNTGPLSSMNWAGIQMLVRI